MVAGVGLRSARRRVARYRPRPQSVAVTIALTILCLWYGCYVQADTPTKGFLFRAPCTSTETERAERMIAIGNQATIILHDDTLWRQAEPLIGHPCELGLFDGRP